jgi:hypothetical protein
VTTRTQAPAGNRLRSLVWPLPPDCISEQTGTILYALKIVPAGGRDVSEIGSHRSCKSRNMFSRHGG